MLYRAVTGDTLVSVLPKICAMFTLVYFLSLCHFSDTDMTVSFDKAEHYLTMGSPVLAYISLAILDW